jgi:large subunit ribosomal protein L41
MPLTTKQGPHNYYKGNRTGAMGRHTKWGGYILDYKKIRTYVCPDLAGFQVRLKICFVAVAC